MTLDEYENMRREQNSSKKQRFRFLRDGEEINASNAKQIFGENWYYLLLYGPVIKNGSVYEMKGAEANV